MGILTREAILEASDLPRELVAVPEWGGEVLVRGLTAAERDDLELSFLQGRGAKREVSLANLRAKLVARSVIDDRGGRLFSEADIEALGKRSATAMQRVYRVAQRLSGMSREEEEELAGNSEGAQSDGSPSDSRAILDSLTPIS